MTFDITAVLVALVGGGLLLGVAALRKAGREADKYNAEAASTLVGSAEDVVKLVRDQMGDMMQHQHDTDARLLVLEQTVGSWEGWAEKVLSILDRALDMLEESHRAVLEPDVREARATRPVRHRGRHITPS